MAEAWTAAEDDRLRALAPTGLGAPRIARRFGRTTAGVHQHASLLGISIAYPRKNPDNPPDEDLAGERVRTRWAALIGPMKDKLRAELEAMGIGGRDG